MRDYASPAFGLFKKDKLVSVVIVLAVFVLLLTSVLAFKRGTAAYNATVGYKALLWLGAIGSLAFILGRRNNPPRVKALIAFVIMAAAFTFAAIASPASQVSFVRLNMYYSFLVFGFVFSHAIGRPSGSTIPALLLALAMLHAPFLAMALLTAMSHNPDVPFVPPYFSNVRHLGYLGFIAAAASLALTLLNPRLRAAGVFLTVYALFGVVVLGSRGALVAWLISAVALAVLYRHWLRVLVIAGLCLCAALGLAYLSETVGLFQAASIFDRSVLTEGVTEGSVGRPAVWLESWRTFLGSPVFGYGPEGFAIAGVTKGMLAQPHNLILQILLESGLVGLVATFAFSWVVFSPRLQAVISLRRGGALDDDEAGLVSVLIGFVAYGMVDGVFYHAVALLCFLVIVSAWIAMRPPIDTSPTRNWV